MTVLSKLETPFHQFFSSVAQSIAATSYLPVLTLSEMNTFEYGPLSFGHTPTSCFSADSSDCSRSALIFRCFLIEVANATKEMDHRIEHRTNCWPAYLIDMDDIDALVMLAIEASIKPPPPNIR